MRRVRERWQTVAFSLRVGAIAWVALIGIVSGLQFLGYVPDLPKLDAVAWGVSLALLGGDNVGSVIMKHRRKTRAKRDRELEKALMALLISLARADPTLRFEDLGANVFELQGDDSLKRVFRFRPAGPQQSGISWTTSKGTVGECATLQRSSYKNWNAIARSYSGGPVTPARWAIMPEETKSGLDYQEFNAIVSKYSEILAEPIWHSGQERKLIGVLTIDRSFRPDHAEFTERLSGRRAEDSAAASASVVADILQPRSTEGD